MGLTDCTCTLEKDDNVDSIYVLVKIMHKDLKDYHVDYVKIEKEKQDAKNVQFQIASLLHCAFITLRDEGIISE